MATIYKRGEAWRASIRIKGVSKSRTLPTQAAAEAWAEVEERRIRGGVAVEDIARHPALLTMKELFDQFKLIHMLNPTHIDPVAERQNVPVTENLWDAERLAEFLGYSANTIRGMASRTPEALPPRAPGFKLRWSPDVVRDWVHGAARRAKRGRPRLPL
jgi:hypothetical protein